VDALHPLATLSTDFKQQLRLLERERNELFYALYLPGGFDADQSGFRLFSIPASVGGERRQPRRPEVKL
jgi:hypothetical protein